MPPKHQESDSASRWIAGIDGALVADAFDVERAPDGALRLGSSRFDAVAKEAAGAHTRRALVAWCRAPIVQRAWRSRSRGASVFDALLSLELPAPSGSLYAHLGIYGAHLLRQPDNPSFDSALDRIVIALARVPLSERLAAACSIEPGEDVH